MDTGTFGYLDDAGQHDELQDARHPERPAVRTGCSVAGIYTHADGVQELVTTFNENQNQMQAWLLRHGVIAWATRGVYFGDQRNYLETTVDDMFNNDESWNPATNPPATRERPWLPPHRTSPARRPGRLRTSSGSTSPSTVVARTTRLGFVSQFKAIDPATNQPYANSFGWINHTYDHPNLDDGCATQNLIQNEISQNLTLGADEPRADFEHRTAFDGGIRQPQRAGYRRALRTREPDPGESGHA